MNVAPNVVVVYWLLLPTLGVAAFVALQHAMIWLSDRDDEIARWTGLWALASFVFIATRFVQKTHLDPKIALVCVRFGLVALCALLYSLVEMVRFVVAVEPPGMARRILRIVLALSLFAGLIGTWAIDVPMKVRVDRTGVAFYAVANPRFIVPLILSGILALLMLARSLRHGHVLRDRELIVESNLFLSGIFVMVLLVVNDALQIFEVYQFVYLSELMPMPLAVAMSVITARRQRQLRARLEMRVAERTSELSDSNRQLQEALRDTVQSESNLRMLFEASPDAIIVARDRDILIGNGAAIRLLGEVQERRLGDLLFNVDLAAPPVDHPQAHDYRRGDGSIGQAELLCKEIKLEGRPANLWILRDVTERKLLESQLQKAERLAALGTLAASVAHEVNNPLSYVHGNIALLKQELDDLGLPVAQREQLGVLIADALEGSNRVRDIVRDLQKFGRSGTDTMGAVDLRRVLEKVEKLARSEVRQRARLSTELTGTGVVRGNELRLMQIVVNLVVNAAQAMAEPDPARNSITVRVTDVSDDEVAILVEDNGPGMAEDQLQRIFEPFFSTRRGGGTGLGLSITRDLVRQLGGSLTVKSEPNTGTTFRVALQRAKLADFAEQPGSQPTHKDESFDGRWRILVIDDEPLIGRAIERMLTRHEVVVARNTADAIAALGPDATWDAVLCDAFLGKESSAGVFAHIEATCPALGARTILMTGGTPAEVAQMGLPKGALMLWKPFDDKHLLECLAVLRDLRAEKA